MKYLAYCDLLNNKCPGFIAPNDKMTLYKHDMSNINLDLYSIIYEQIFHITKPCN